MRSEALKLSKRGLRIGRSNAGRGLFAAQRFVDGACIGQIDGTVIVDPDYESRYAFCLGDGTVLEPNSPFRFVNHSCDANCAFDVFQFETQPASTPRILLFAICDIRIGEELTIDYGWPDSYAIPCRCKSSDCRGWVVRRDSPLAVVSSSPQSPQLNLE